MVQWHCSCAYVGVKNFNFEIIFGLEAIGHVMQTWFLILFSSNGKQGFLETRLILVLGLGQEIYKIRMEHIVTP